MPCYLSFVPSRKEIAQKNATSLMQRNIHFAAKVINIIENAQRNAQKCAFLCAVLFSKASYSLLNNDGFVLRHKSLHDAPANEISHSTDAEHDHIGGRLAIEAEERKGRALFSCPSEELS